MREFVRGAAKVSYRHLRLDPWVCFGLATVNQPALQWKPELPN